uniref:Uncharacterized protein n=1 Tax=Anopheles culicifacies TaxID=139723 RepID=A0A182MB02_9DIPT
TEHVQVPVSAPIPVESRLRSDRFGVVLGRPVVIALTRRHHRARIATRLDDATVHEKVRVTARVQNTTLEHIRVDNLHKLRIRLVELVLVRGKHEQWLGRVQSRDALQPSRSEIVRDHAGSLSTETETHHLDIVQRDDVVGDDEIEQLCRTVRHRGKVSYGLHIARFLCQRVVIDGYDVELVVGEVCGSNCRIWCVIAMSSVAMDQHYQRASSDEVSVHNRLGIEHVQLGGIVLGIS